MPNPDSPGLELKERRRHRGAIVRVWDWTVRLSHWIGVLLFAIIYLKYEKFPIHTYAGYALLLVVAWRLGWGVIGSKAARFSTFWAPPRQAWIYLQQTLRGDAGYYASHNPMGAWMALSLWGLILINGILGLLLYSASQQLGPFGAHVPTDWEDGLLAIHRFLGHTTALLTATHIFGMLMSSRLHRENYVLAMITGHKRVARNARPDKLAEYPPYAESRIPNNFRPLEHWMNSRHPFSSSLVLTALIVLVVLGLTEALVGINKHLLAY